MWKANGKGMNVGVTTFQKHLIIPRKDGCTTRMEVEYENKKWEPDPSNESGSYFLFLK